MEAGATEKLNSKWCEIFNNFNTNRGMWLKATVLGSTALDQESTPFLVKGQVISIFSFVGHVVPVAIT